MSGRRDRSRQGFTLIELLAVIGIIVVLMGIVMAGASYGQRAADRSRARSQIELISMALDRYNSSFTMYPTNFTVAVPNKGIGVFSNLVIFASDLLNMRLATNSPAGGGLRYVAILDPWENPIIYSREKYNPWSSTERFKEDHFELRSFGPDGISNTVDDVVSTRGN